MRKVFIITQFIATAGISSVSAQNNYQNIENFKSGTVLVFQECKTDLFETESTGENITWDYSKLKKADTTITQQIVSPDSVGAANEYPDATLVEKYSDGRYVFLKADQNKTYLLGFVDEKSKVKIKYPVPVLIAKRPFSYKETAEEHYTVSYTVNQMDFTGKGTVTIEADGFGTLILPDKSYNNTLRIKITQHQSDTMKQYNSTSEMAIVTYVWFDKHHTSALLKITETKSQYHVEKSIEYLLSETIK